MKAFFLKLFYFSLLIVLYTACSTTKNLDEDALLLVDNTIYIDSTKTKKSLLYDQLYQKPNVKLLGLPLRLHIYNLARDRRDSIFDEWLYRTPKRRERLVKLLSEKQLYRLRESLTNFNSWLRTTGEAPVLIDSAKMNRSIKRLESYYWNNGWFNVKGSYQIQPTDSLKAAVEYHFDLQQPYLLDSVKVSIASKIADSIYQRTKAKSLLKKGTQYKTKDLETERNRITTIFRNSGLYHFDQDFIKYVVDTIGTNRKALIDFQISNRSVTKEDSTGQIPFQVHKISKVNIITDSNFRNTTRSFSDSVLYKKFQLYSYDKMRFGPKAITDAVFITPGKIYRDLDRSRTYNQINNLRMFKYPSIAYQIDPDDPTGADLMANITLTPLKKYAASFNFDLSTSTIQQFGIGFGGTLLTRNFLKGAEILEVSARGSIGSSRDPIQDNSQFFNITEIGADLKLTFPSILFPTNTDWVIPKFMSPRTAMSVGLSTQQNIGLDKQNVTGIFNYNWQSSIRSSNQLDLINVQYVRNLNPENYFNVYRTSLDNLQLLAARIPADQLLEEVTVATADSFIAAAQGGTYNAFLDASNLQDINNISQRKDRLTEDNLIFTSNFTYARNSSLGLFDEDFSRIRIKLELAGNLLSTIATTSRLSKNENNRYELFGVEFSQYAKTELSYIKHVDLGRKRVFAFRLFGGIAVPFGNSNSIPFSRSFFGGGSNDNRGWQAYDLGPGSTGGLNEFNEANLKLAFNAEYRFNIASDLFGALFVDAGNIWNVLDKFEEDEAASFTSFSDLEEFAVGSGFGLRYDFSFFVFRLDLGFKTYDPAQDTTNQWFKGYNFSEVVYNIGINYPF